MIDEDENNNKKDKMENEASNFLIEPFPLPNFKNINILSMSKSKKFIYLVVESELILIESNTYCLMQLWHKFSNFDIKSFLIVVF